MSAFLYSVIIPHYNTPDLLMRCLSTIPVRPDVQVVVVDDCSLDASRYLADYPALTRPYLSFLSTPKGGSVGRARNLGLDHALGEWICFVDADDYLEDGYFPEALDSTYDLHLRNWRLFGDGPCKSHADNREQVCSGESASEYIPPQTIANDASLRDFWLQYGHLDLIHTVWGKFFSRSIIERMHIRFNPEYRIGEDTLFDMEYYTHCRSISVTDSARYMYYRPADWCIKYRLSLADTFIYLRDFERHYRALAYPIPRLAEFTVSWFYTIIQNNSDRLTRLRYLSNPVVFRINLSASSDSVVRYFLRYAKWVCAEVIGMKEWK